MPDPVIPAGRASLASNPVIFGALVFFATSTLALSVMMALRGGSGAGDGAAISSLTREERAVVEIFSRVSPSVVNITATGVEHSPFEHPRADVIPPPGTGSGIVWDEAGHIITNQHVISGRGGTDVTLADGSTWKGILVSFAENLDLAVLAIGAPRDRLVPIALGSSEALLVGQKVYAIGNPFGLDHTLTAGVISGLDRRIEARNGAEIGGVIQTDAAINPGNSGGSLLDSAGRLIGVNTAIHESSDTSAGIGFAIPVQTLAEEVPRMIREGFQLRPMLGLVLAPDEFSQTYIPLYEKLMGAVPNLPGTSATPVRGIQGILVFEILPGSPAERAGFEPWIIDPSVMIVLGDVLVGVDGSEVRFRSQLDEALSHKKAGDEVRLTVMTRRLVREERLLVLQAQE